MLTSAYVDYEKYTEQFCLQSTRNYFIDSLTTIDADKITEEIASSSMDSDLSVMPSNVNEDLVNEIYNSVNELSKLHEELTNSQSRSVNSKENADEILKLQRLLESIENEESQINLDINENLMIQQSLNEKQKQILDKRNENQKKGSLKASMNTREELGESKVMSDVKEKEYAAILDSLKALMGIESFQVEKDDKRMIIQLNIVFDGNVGSTCLTIDQTLCLSNVKIINKLDSAYDHSTDEMNVLTESKNLGCPQDLRYALFATQAILRSQTLLSQDINILKKKCLIKKNSMDNRRLTITTIEGLAYQIVTHSCYPQVPQSAWIEKVQGMICADSERNCTSKSFANLTKLYESCIENQNQA